ncbi:hypothetical protein K491DRAFT_669801 [Lophiostoma macrostomum CBS 122681]|uniref:CFEM domain-containing protein n=1 Tax=Lophiostoma macrostomum CBS 122681 TaxID=1314788 RepID=A0A6A6SPL9_9PLEO|nr:hypothetical protein K491DRAFT_669801 [Lophiostoma macrostomum CBS 122681]
MHFTTILTGVVALIAPLATAAQVPAYNLTQALESGNWNKYHCMDTNRVVKLLPKCLTKCNYIANSKDGCAYDDIACHCVNYNKYSPLVEKCAFPKSMGGDGACTLAELGVARPIVNDVCNFFNATLYANYVHCPQRLSPRKTFTLIAEGNGLKVPNQQG